MSDEYSFGMIAKNRRRELGLTQDELARRVGCAPITVRKIEADDLRPSVQIAERLAMALNIPLEERSAFVRLARMERPVLEEPSITPMPAPEEIGSEDLSGRAIRGYALGERLGNGGMGVVYRAVQPLVEREVAIKIIMPMYANHPDFIRRFEAEAQLVARLEHPHIVPLYDYWREPGVAYLIMRLLRGGSVQSLLRGGTVLSSETVLRMMEQIGSALSSSHRAGVVHRDLKPANVLLDEDNNAYLADFGIAKNLSSPSSETQADMVIGSPDYISPEQIRSEFVRPQTDIYALGVMLYELLAGKVPFRGNTPFDVMSQHLNTPLPMLAEHRMGLPKSLDDVIKHATAKDPLERYENVELMLNDLRNVLGTTPHEIKSKASSLQETLPPLTEMDNPYKGLRPFMEGDALDFYGRETLIQQLLIKLGEAGELSRFLAVVGPSGSGKSSVVKAGLLPALRRGALPGSENWFIVEMMPGAHPLEELEAALLRVAVNPPSSLMEQFHRDSRGLIRAVRRSLPNDPSIDLVLVIDQFEEVFTLVQDEAERLRFLGLLVTAIMDEHSRIRVILTLRADFIDRPLGYVDFGELLRQRMEVILPLTPDELESAIASPTERVGLHLESGLVAAILRDLGDQPGTLPLLQYALTELYEKRAGNTLTKSAYHDIGGVLGALGRRAEEVFKGLDPEGQVIARQIFLRLVTLGEGVEDTRRRALISELENLKLSDVDLRKFSRSFKATLDAFGNARLLSFDRDPGTRGPTVEVAHEAIIREWGRLRDWLEENRTLVRMQRLLSTAASEWMGAQRDPSFLLSGTKLAQYEGWTESSAIALTQHELDYLKVSVSARDQREMEEAERQQRELETVRKLAETESSRAELQTKSAKQLRQRAVFLSGALVLAMIAAIIAGVIGNRNSRLAIQNENTASTAQAAEALAIQERDHAESENKLSVSRELAAAAINDLAVDPERSILLALQAESTSHTIEAENALHRSLAVSRVLFALQHDGAVMSVAYSPDGKRIVTSSWDETAKVWDANTGKLLLTLIGHTNGLTCAIYSPDGKRIATASYDNTIKLWDANTGKELLTLNGHTGWIHNINFSPDGTRLVTGSEDKTAGIWDTTSGEEILILTGHHNAVEDVAFSPDGKQVATSSGMDGNIRIWDAVTGTELLKIPVEQSSVIYGIAYSPDGKQIISGGDSTTGEVKEWDAITGNLLFEGNFNHTGWIYDVAYSPNGRLAATGGYDPKVEVWDTLTKEVLFTLSGHTHEVTSIAFSPDGTRLATSSTDGSARIWTLETPHEVLNIPFEYPFSSYWGVSYSSDGKRILTGYADKNARIWDAVTGEELIQLKGQDIGGNPTAFSQDGKLAAGVNKDNSISIWDTITGRQVSSLIGHTNSIQYLNFSPDGASLASASMDGTVITWDLNSRKPLLTLQVTIDGVVSLDYSPDGRNLVTGGYGSNGVDIWDSTTGEKILNIPFVNVSSVFCSPDGKLIAIGGFDGTVGIWNATTGSLVWELNSQAGSIEEIVINPKGNLIATGSLDGTARIWDITNGTNILTLFVENSGVGGVAFSPDGNHLAVGSPLGISIFLLPIQDVMELARLRVTRSLTTEECQKYLHVDACPAIP